MGWLFRSRTSPAMSEATPAEDALDEVPVEAAPAAQTLEWPRVEEPVAEEPVEPEPEPVAAAEPEPEAPEPVGAAESHADAPLDPDRALVILDEALDALGAAHHRPFSRG